MTYMGNALVAANLHAHSAYVLIVRRMTSRAPHYARGRLGTVNGSRE